MNKILKKSVLNVAVATVMTVGFASSAMAAGGIGPLNILTGDHIALPAIVAADDISNLEVYAGVITNNSSSGWNLKVTSDNGGYLQGDTGTTVAGSQIPYTLYHLNKGTASGSVMGVEATGSVYGSAAPVSGVYTFATSAVSSATVHQSYNVGVSWLNNTSLLAGTYSDTFTLVLAAN
jgi:hypothetical protein